MSDSTVDAHENRPESAPGRPIPPVEDARDEKVARLETIVSDVLRFGVWLSLSITFIGLVLLFVTDPAEAVVRRTGSPMPHIRRRSSRIYSSCDPKRLFMRD